MPSLCRASSFKVPWYPIVRQSAWLSHMGTCMGHQRSMQTTTMSGCLSVHSSTMVSYRTSVYLSNWLTGKAVGFISAACKFKHDSGASQSIKMHVVGLFVSSPSVRPAHGKSYRVHQRSVCSMSVPRRPVNQGIMVSNGPLICRIV